MINSAKRYGDRQCLGTRFPSGKKKTVKDPKDPKVKHEVEILTDYIW